jgi:hypothetical protein
MSKLELADIFKYIVPDEMYEDADYQHFLYLLSIIYTDINGLIEKFPELVDVDNAEELFLPKLSALIGYDYRYNIDIDDQREIIKNILQVYRDRGTDDSIIMAATYGNDEKWVGGHLFVPGANVSKRKAYIEHPIDSIFRFSISALSGPDKMEDGSRYRPGTIVVHVYYIDDTIREAIRKVVPAGIKIFYQLDGEADNIIEFGEWTLWTDYLLTIEPRLIDYDETLIFSVIQASSHRYLSGRQTFWTAGSFTIDTGSTFYPYSKLSSDDFVSRPTQDQISRIINHNIDTDYLTLSKILLAKSGPFKFSDPTTILGDTHAMSGLFTGTYEGYIPMTQFLPTDQFYAVGAVLAYKPYEYTPDTNLITVASSVRQYKETDSDTTAVYLANSFYPVSKLVSDDYVANANTNQIKTILAHDITTDTLTYSEVIAYTSSPTKLSTESGDLGSNALSGVIVSRSGKLTFGEEDNIFGSNSALSGLSTSTQSTSTKSSST